MPGRPILRDLRYRNETICRSCLLNLQRRPVPQTQQPWAVHYSSQTMQRQPRSRAEPQSPSPVKKSAIQTPPPHAGMPRGLDKAAPTKQETFESHDYTARYFEQDGDKIMELPDDGSFEQGLDGMDPAALKLAFEHMRRVVPPKQRAALDEVLGMMGDSWAKMRTTADLENVIEKLGKYNAAIDSEIAATLQELPQGLREETAANLGPLLPTSQDRLSFGLPTVPQVPLKSYTANQRKKISRLNTAMSRVAREMRFPDGLASKHVSAVYRAYHSARMSLAHSWSNVPLEVWDFVWSVFAAEESVNPHRLAHVSLLARDMADAKVSLSPPQQLLTIEAVFVDGWEAKALDNWKRCIPSLGDRAAETFKDFWELGVHMYCRAGDMDQAQRGANKLLDNDSDPRILMPIIRTYSERGSPEDRDKGWLAYRRMRELLGQNMKLSDYDQVVSYFLTTNQTENALFAFVDMMSDGHIDLKKQKYMPSVVANKFFLGKWLKRLIGAGDLDGAHNVVEFMRHKGVKAAPIHLNGLIGAWQRSGGAENTEKADGVAWKMIDSRIEFVKARKQGKLAVTQGAKSAAPFPRATLETFSVLAENYRLRNLHDRMGALWDAFRDAEISPDAFMMNQLLESYVQAGQPEQASALYQSLVRERGLSPDPYTFSALWKVLGINRLHRVPVEHLGAEALAARQLFAEMARFRAIFGPDGMDGQLARKILHTFRRVKDDAGFLVVLTSLKELFKFLPTETLVLEMVLGTTRLSWDAPAQRRRLMGAKRELDHALVGWAGNDVTKLEGDGRREALYEYLRRNAWPASSHRDKRSAFKEAAEQMGVSDALAARKGTLGAEL